MARPTMRTRSSHSFHAGSPIPTSLFDTRRRSSYRYHTFPTPALETPREARDSPFPHDGGGPAETPLPVRQLTLLALLSFAEQTALNSISPYIPSMIGSFAEVPDAQVGLYVGILASAFALAQLSTNFFWGFLSDRVGRKPVLVAGALLLTGCFGLFGFCGRYWQALVVHVLMGLLNGNAAVVPSALGDMTDRSNQSTVFTWLPIIYSLGGLSGPALGGLLVGTMGEAYPFAVPNVVVAALLAVCTLVVAVWFEETHPEHEKLGAGLDKVRERIGAVGRPLLHPHKGRANGGEARVDQGVDAEDESVPGDIHPEDSSTSLDSLTQPWRAILNRSTVALLASYLVYQLANISFSSLYPIFAAAPTPTGRDLGTGVIGVSLSVSGLFTIVFQAFLFKPIKARFGNLRLYRFALLGIAVSMIAMPWVGYKEGEPPLGRGKAAWWLYAELGVVLVLKNVAAVGGLSCVMLLVSFHPFFTSLFSSLLSSVLFPSGTPLKREEECFVSTDQG